MSNPLVTIGIPCFNAQDTIARAVESALSQDWPNFEIIVVDDCSTDSSAAVVQSLIGRKPARIKMICHSCNQGPAASRNTIIDAANGVFVVFFDDDDESLPERVTVQVRTLLKYEQATGKSLIACYAGGSRHYPNGYVKPLPAIGSQGISIPQGPAVAEYLLLYRKQPNWFYGAGTPTCSLLARKSTFTSVGGFDASLRRAEDADFAIRLGLQGGHFIGTADCLFIQYSTDALDKSPEKNLEAEQQIADKHRVFLESLNRYYYAMHWPKLRYWHFKRQYGRFLAEFLGLVIRYPFPVAKHLLSTGLQRLRHERLMTRRAAS